MPYKDIKKRREVIRKSVYKLRARIKEAKNSTSEVIIVNPVNPKKRYSNKNASNLQIEESMVYIKKYLSEINKKLHEWKINWDENEEKKRGK